MNEQFTTARNTLIGWTMNELFRGRLTAVQADVIKARVREMEVAVEATVGQKEAA